METKSAPFFTTEKVLAVIALLCALLLVAMIVICLPYFSGKGDHPDQEETGNVQLAPENEDPEALKHNQAEPVAPDEDVLPTIPPEANPYGRLDFQYDRNNYLYALKTDSYAGIDVSAYQGEIDWEKVKASGIDFAIIRLGFRGYGEEGKLVEDEMAQTNLQGAAEACLPIGAYFFSQALSIEEADEEIKYMLEILGDYELQMPIVLDWEIPTDTARTANMDARTLTEIQKHFCALMTEKGYQPMVYFNWHQASNLLYLSELEDYPFWLALYRDRMTYPYKVEMWQYTDKGQVPGIEGNVDINVYMPN